MFTLSRYRCLFWGLTALALGCNLSAPPPPAAEPTVVTVAPPIEKAIRDHIDYTGRTEAVESVTVRARVGGYLDSVDFKEGEDVKKNQVLFVIDPRPYKAELDRAQASVKLHEAELKQAEAEYRRVVNLRKSGAATQDDLEKALRTRDVADASIAESKATVAQKQLNLDFTKVLAPIDGRVDKANITVGNLVTADLGTATILTNIVTLDPIYVYFDVDERTMLLIQKRQREGQLKPRKEQPPDVMLEVGEERGYPHKGTIDFVSNQVNPQTGTIRVRGVFANKDRVLTPGLFARIQVPLGDATKKLLVSERVIVSDGGLKYVYVVDDDNTVVPKVVKLGTQENGLRVIESGVDLKDRIIVTGLQRVRPGLTVNPKDGTMLLVKE